MTPNAKSSHLKEFSVERSARLRNREKELHKLLEKHQQEGLDVSVALDPTGVSNAELLGEISALKREVAALRSGLSEPQERLLDGEGEKDVRTEIALMVRAIGRAKSEIAAIQHPMSENSRVEDASSELDEIVQATETATNAILEANEAIEEEIHKLAGNRHEDDEIILATDKIACEVIKIFEASNFQDITGQRVTKVVKTLHFIEERIAAMIDIWGIEAFSDLPVENESDGDSEESLMNGPQLGNAGITQADVDALFD